VSDKLKPGVHIVFQIDPVLIAWAKQHATLEEWRSLEKASEAYATYAEVLSKDPSVMPDYDAFFDYAVDQEAILKAVLDKMYADDKAGFIALMEKWVAEGVGS
jgi:hypothetical protein